MTAGTEALRWMKRQERRGRWQEGAEETGRTTRKQVEIKGIKVTRLRQIHGCQLLMCCINAWIFVNSSLHWSHLIRMSFRLTHFRTRMKIESHFDPDRDGGFKGSQGPGRVIN